ncbi:unnamed protein product [Effrenium voratum]|nr:unnamed protein product [Effrenium voratum]
MAPGSTFDPFADHKPPGRRVKEWSPIDRMLAEKGSKRRSKTELPPLSPPPPVVTTAEAQVQSTSWEALLKEALAPELQKQRALQSDLKALQLRLKEKQCELDAQSEAHAAEQAQWAEDRRSVEDFKKTMEKARTQWLQEQQALEASHNLLSAELRSARSELEAERYQREELEKDLASQQDSARKARAQSREEVEVLQDQLRRSQDDMKSLQKQMAALKEEHASVAKERDDLLQRLEDEQAEMILRVAAVEERLSKREVKGQSW